MQCTRPVGDGEWATLCTTHGRDPDVGVSHRDFQEIFVRRVETEAVHSGMNLRDALYANCDRIGIDTAPLLAKWGNVTEPIPSYDSGDSGAGVGIVDGLDSSHELVPPRTA